MRHRHQDDWCSGLEDDHRQEEAESACHQDSTEDREEAESAFLWVHAEEQGRALSELRLPEQPGPWQRLAAGSERVEVLDVRQEQVLV